MHISNFSVASLFSEMQSVFNSTFDSTSSVGFSAGQNIPSSPAASSTSSVTTTPPAATTPSSQFASDLLSHLLESQQSWSQTAAGDVINSLNPGGTSLDLSQVEQALTGSTASTSPQQLAIANAFNQLTGGTGQLTQSQLAQSLQSMGTSMDGMGMGHHHHHHFGAEFGSNWFSNPSSNVAGSSSTPTTSDASTPSSG